MVELFDAAFDRWLEHQKAQKKQPHLWRLLWDSWRTFSNLRWDSMALTSCFTWQGHDNLQSENMIKQGLFCADLLGCHGTCVSTLFAKKYVKEMSKLWRNMMMNWSFDDIDLACWLFFLTCLHIPFTTLLTSYRTVFQDHKLWCFKHVLIIPPQDFVAQEYHGNCTVHQGDCRVRRQRSFQVHFRYFRLLHGFTLYLTYFVFLYYFTCNSWQYFMYTPVN